MSVKNALTVSVSAWPGAPATATVTVDAFGVTFAFALNGQAPPDDENISFGDGNNLDGVPWAVCTLAHLANMINTYSTHAQASVASGAAGYCPASWLNAVSEVDMQSGSVDLQMTEAYVAGNPTIPEVPDPEEVLTSAGGDFDVTEVSAETLAAGKAFGVGKAIKGTLPPGRVVAPMGPGF